jgi:hypothetical protein
MLKEQRGQAHRYLITRPWQVALEHQRLSRCFWGTMQGPPAAWGSGRISAIHILRTTEGRFCCCQPKTQPNSSHLIMLKVDRREVWPFLRKNNIIKSKMLTSLTLVSILCWFILILFFNWWIMITHMYQVQHDIWIHAHYKTLHSQQMLWNI